MSSGTDERRRYLEEMVAANEIGWWHSIEAERRGAAPPVEPAAAPAGGPQRWRDRVGRRPPPPLTQPAPVRRLRMTVHAYN